MSNPNPPSPEQQIQQVIDATKNTGAMPLEVRLETGEVYRADTPQELLNKVVAGKVEANRTALAEKRRNEELQSEIANLKQQIPPPPADASETEKQAYFQKWALTPDDALAEQIGKKIGVPADKVWGLLKKTVDTSVSTSAADEFIGRYPGFPNDAQTANLIKSRLSERFGQTIDATSADNIELVYNELVRAGRIAPPQMAASGVSQQNLAVANLRGSQSPPNPQNSILQDFAKLPLEQMKAALDAAYAKGLR